jgi:NitT/TauT family transport system permease protein
MKNFITKHKLISFFAVFILLAAWQVIAMSSGSSQILPSPLQTLESLKEIVISKTFLPSIGSTVIRGLAGFFIALALALLLGIPAGLSKPFFLFLNPVLVTVRSTPVISIILLAIIWLGSQKVPVFIAILTMFPIMCGNIIEGIKNVDKSLIEMARVHKVKNARILLHISLPSIIPFLTGGISNALGFGWRAIIIGEVLAQPSMGIGTRMQDAQIFLQVGDLIAWTLIAILISYFFESIMRLIESKYVTWK